MNAIDVAKAYFDGWNGHDPAAVMAMFAPDGRYSDPTVQDVRGEAIGRMVQGLINSFPDLAFDLKSEGMIGADLVAAEWLMRGTHRETGRTIALPGADFIRVENGKIGSVQGYFDNKMMMEQLGLTVTVYPAEAQGPISFGLNSRFQSDKNAVPGAISITWIDARSEADGQHLGRYTDKIVEQTTQLPGFLGMMVSTMGTRGYTITAWEDVKQPRQLLREGAHKESMKWFFGEDSTAMAMTSVWEVHHTRMFLRCLRCKKVVEADGERKSCTCGEPLPESPPFL
jgi:steroid delta-isomerase-like uncharacterized protein